MQRTGFQLVYIYTQYFFSTTHIWSNHSHNTWAKCMTEWSGLICPQSWKKWGSQRTRSVSWCYVLRLWPIQYWWMANPKAWSHHQEASDKETLSLLSFSYFVLKVLMGYSIKLLTKDILRVTLFVEIAHI